MGEGMDGGGEMFYWGLVIGVFVGFWLGVLTICLFVISGIDDTSVLRDKEEEYGRLIAPERRN